LLLEEQRHSPPSCREKFPKMAEQLLTVVIRQRFPRCRPRFSEILLEQRLHICELGTLILQRRQLSIFGDPFGGRSEPHPTGHIGRNINFAPFRVSCTILEQINLSKEFPDKFGHPNIPS